MDGPVPGVDVVGIGLGATLLTMVLSPLLAVVLVAVFRRSLRRSMRAGVAAPAFPAVPVPRPQPGRRGPGPVTAFAVAQVRRAAFGYVVAGIAYATTGAVVLLVVNGEELGTGRILVVALVFAWPLLPTLAVVLAPGRLRIAAAVAGYVAVLLLVGAAFGLDAGMVALVWGTFALPAVLVLATVAPRRLRAVGPFLAPSAFVLGTGLMVWPRLALPIVSAGASATVATVLALVVVLVATVAAFGNVWLAARRHLRRAASDQSVQIDQWWLLAALFPCLVTSASRGPAGFALLVLPYAAHRVVVHLSRRSCGRRAAAHRPSRLLVLRVFGSPVRSRRLLRDIGSHWRYAGSIDLIAASDLATEHLEPHEFLQFVRGRMARRFVTGPQDLDERIAARELRPDRDGLHRVTEFFCHDDTWRATVDRLLAVTDVVLIDLRGLTPQRRGVAYELRRLIELGLLDRVVALVDGTTDPHVLHAVLQAAGGGHPPPLCTVRMERGGRAEVLEVLTRLEAAGRPAGESTVTAR